MKKSSTIKSIAAVSFSNIIGILTGVIVGFCVPKILSVNDYGWLKVFSLYITYVGFFNLGLIDGIVLKYGGFDYEELDKKLFRNYFRWYILIHVFFLVLLSIVAVFIHDANYSVIVFSVGVYAILANILGYFQQISQITQRFKEYTLRKIIYSGLKLMIVGILAVCSLAKIGASYQLYLLLFLLSETVIAIWYIKTYKEIVFGESLPIKGTKSGIIMLSKTGFPLLFANLCSTLILAMDRQFVSVLFTTEVYAKYAFAYQMLALVTVAMSAVSTVLYPTLKRTTAETMKKTYGTLVIVILVFVFAANTLYFPLCFFINWFLPRYVESLPVFRIIFPGLAISTCVTVIMHNYYKALGYTLKYFVKSIVVLCVSCIANLVAYLIFRSVYSISIASIITMIFWYILIEQLFVKEYGYSRWKNLLFILLMMTEFYLCTNLVNKWIAMIVYISVFLMTTCLFYRSTIKNDFKSIIS